MDVLRIFLEANWMPHSGSMTFVQQITVTLYLLTAILTFGLVWFVCKGKALFRYDPIFWAWVGTTCVAMAINRSFNMQSALTSTLRVVAYQGYWYNTRRSIQEPIIVGLIIASIVLLLSARWFARPIWQHYKLTTLGVILLITLVAVRSVSLHAADALLYRPVLGLYAHQLIELSATALVILGALPRFKMLVHQRHLT